jgi:hypothetical protein
MTAPPAARSPEVLQAVMERTRAPAATADMIFLIALPPLLPILGPLWDENETQLLAFALVWLSGEARVLAGKGRIPTVGDKQDMSGFCLASPASRSGVRPNPIRPHDNPHPGSGLDPMDGDCSIGQQFFISR